MFLKRESAKNRKVKKNLTAPQWPLAKLTGAKYILVGAIPHTHTLSLCLCLSLSLSLSLILPLKTKETQYLKLKDIDLRRLSLVLQSFNSLSLSLFPNHFNSPYHFNWFFSFFFHGERLLFSSERIVPGRSPRSRCWWWSNMAQNSWKDAQEVCLWWYCLLLLLFFSLMSWKDILCVWVCFCCFVDFYGFFC